MSAEAPALDVTVENAGPCSRVLKIKVPASRVDHEIDQTYKNVLKTVQFPGFRAGKVPRKLVEARLGDRVMQEVLERPCRAPRRAVDSTKLRRRRPRLKDLPTTRAARTSRSPSTSTSGPSSRCPSWRRRRRAAV
jgi:hypothetical protein